MTGANISPSSGSAASGRYQIISLRPTDGGSDPQYRVKSKSESHERVVSESDLVSSAASNFDD